MSERCAWARSWGEDDYTTACGESFPARTDITDTNARYCCFCGKHADFERPFLRLRTVDAPEIRVPEQAEP